MAHFGFISSVRFDSLRRFQKGRSDMGRSAARRTRRRKPAESDPRFVLKLAGFAGLLLTATGLIVELVVLG